MPAIAGTGGDALRSGLLAGAILADFGKGPIDSKWPLELQAGIRLHRRIDAFTNPARRDS